MHSGFGGVYRNRRVLITGHTGFKGAWLSLWLNELGANVYGYALDPPGTPSLFHAAAVERAVDHVVGDIGDFDAFSARVAAVQPEFVFHMAAQAIVRASYTDPIETFRVNVMGTAHLLEALRSCESVRACVVVTSDKCYENQEWLHAYRESDPMGGHDPYSASKGCAELVTSSYRRSFLRPPGRSNRPGVASARAGNVIGGGDWAEGRILPDCVRALADGKTVVLRNPRAVRPWQHVLEPLSGYLQLGRRLLDDPDRFEGAWNFGPAEVDPPCVSDVVEQVIAVWGAGSYEVESGDHPHEAGLLKLDIGKAARELPWKPRYTAAEAIERTVNWYREYYREPGRNDMAERTRAEIREYQHLLSGA